jgi:hypothetical protein
MKFVTSLAGFLCLGVAAWRRMRISHRSLFFGIDLPVLIPGRVQVDNS